MIVKLQRYFAVISKGKYNMILDVINPGIIMNGVLINFTALI